MIVGLSGYARAGKDTVGEILVEHHGFHRVSFADALKRLALRLDPVLDIEGDDATYKARLAEVAELTQGGLDAAKLEYPAVREYLQRLGTEARNTLGLDCWVHAARLAEAERAHGNVVVTDMRFRNEAQRVKDLGGVTLRIHRPGVKPVNGHRSEVDLDDFRFDGHLYNDGSLDKLQVQVGQMVAYLNFPQRHVQGVKA